MLASADTELALKRGLRTWPRGAAWPTKVASTTESPAADHKQELAPQADPEAESASRKLAQKQEAALAEQTDREKDSISENRTTTKGAHRNPFVFLYALMAVNFSPATESSDAVTRPLSDQPCEVWIGSSESNKLDSSRLDDLDEDALLKRDGIGIVYIPLAANDAKVPGFDPFSISTWRREVTADESQALLDVSEARRLSDLHMQRSTH